MDKMLVFDLAKCTGCRSCEVACATTQEGLASTALSRIKVVPFEDQDFFCPTVCQQCETPYCALVCPTGALHRNPETGIVDWLEEKCVACKMCLLACPFGAINIKDGTRILKCDLCGGNPVCARFCPYEAITYSSADEIGAPRRAAIAETLKIAYTQEEK